MLIRHVLLGLFGFTGGIGVAAGTFAFIIALGLIPRMIDKSKTAKDILIYEDMIILGGIIGNVAWIFDVQIPFGLIFLIIAGFSMGIFVGGLAAALAEVLNTFPVLFRRIKLHRGLVYIIFFFAIGKTAGALWFFYHNMSIGQ